jgi:ABC-type polysaccharide/polyol phosphate transport system ATPase subunit
MFLGLSRQQIAERTDDIVSFSELGDYMDLPVRTYSTGMVMRFGFALATSIDPDILLLDEGLGAGDARFAERAADRIRSLITRSSILIFASHDDSLIKMMCNRAVLLEHGQIVADGEVDHVLKEYHERQHRV